MTHHSSRLHSEDDTANVNKVVVGTNGSISVACRRGWRGRREKNLLHFDAIFCKNAVLKFSATATVQLPL